MKEAPQPLRYIEEDLEAQDSDKDWIESWAKVGVDALAAYLQKHVEFTDYLDTTTTSEQ